ncbi:MAG TPA: nitrate- and nitrite sensing domain-containing protein [Actinoplanes sp.]|nr:nitrate- and nitrite sensing domain-containing protein [Actinoplanes sp.]
MARSRGSIRGRMIRMLALPVAAMLLLLSVVVAGEYSTYRLAARTDHAITLDLAVQALVQEVQTERGVTVGMLAGNAGLAAEVPGARQRVDTQRAAVQRVLDERGDLDGQVAEALEHAEELAGIRDDVDGGAPERADVFEQYNDVIGELGEVYFALDNAGDAAMRLGTESLAMLNLAKEATARQRAFLSGVFSAGGFAEGEFLRFVQLRAELDASIAEFEEYATPEAIAAKDRLLSTEAAQRADQLQDRALRSGDGQAIKADPQLWWTSTGPVLDDMAQLARAIGDAMRDRAATLLAEANLRLAGLGAVILICAGIAVYLGTIAAQSIAGPLADLAVEANRLAGQRLPEAVRRAADGQAAEPPGPVEVSARASTETRLVADAFDRVQGTAYRLATEQAELRRATAESLANMGRRNQNLLRRQLGFITRLEQEESDPAGLANLFELDHLATRMRRNAESLLVLVGAASPRQWAQPIPLADVIRAAVSEVEEYRRVSLRRLDDALVSGAVVSGLAHMLAELIENGLNYSPPDLDVEIHGRRVDDGYLIAICDQGIGMSTEELGRSNRRLRGEGDFISAPARFLGHYVVGRLAADTGVEVELARSAVTGVTARVSVPASLLRDTPAVPAAQPSPAPAPPVASARPVASAPPVASVPPVASAPPMVPVPPAALPPARDRGIPDQRARDQAAPDREPGPRPLPAEIDYVVLGEPDHGEHTVNGLRRRVPRARRSGTRRPDPAARRPDQTARHPDSAARNSDPAARPDTAPAPDAVRTRLTALRDGIQRGAGQARHAVPEEIS